MYRRSTEDEHAMLMQKAVAHICRLYMEICVRELRYFSEVAAARSFTPGILLVDLHALVYHSFDLASAALAQKVRSSLPRCDHKQAALAARCRACQFVLAKVPHDVIGTCTLVRVADTLGRCPVHADEEVVRNQLRLMRHRCRKALLTLAVLACTNPSAGVHINGQLQRHKTVGQTSIPYNRAVTGSDPLSKLPFNDTRLVDTSGGVIPSQVKPRRPV